MNTVVNGEPQGTTEGTHVADLSTTLRLLDNARAERDELREMLRGKFDAATRLGVLREAVEHEVRQLETSARISEPSRKTDIERAVAGRLRKLLEDQ